MIKGRNLLIVVLLIIKSLIASATNLPANFVYLKEIDPTIVQDIRYAGYHNFIGRPIKGYNANQCILTKPAALQLSKVQHELEQMGYVLKIYDCYRPQMAVNDFIAWSHDPSQQQMKVEFYPRINKTDFFKLGYVATKSGHSRGSTVDLTIMPISSSRQDHYQPGQKMAACFAPYGQRFNDNTIDMGTSYDCMDALSHSLNKSISKTAFKNRVLLRQIMEKYGFIPYNKEWWHFTLRTELYSKTYFDFTIN